jgi:hypothetical protein
MKMRVRGNSIRLRLKQTEVAELTEKGLVEEVIEFGEKNKLFYALGTSAEAGKVRAEFHENRIKIVIPHAQAKSWSESEQTGIEAEQETGDGKILKLLIEKDFACLKPRKGEEDKDAFPNPAENAEC